MIRVALLLLTAVIARSYAYSSQEESGTGRELKTSRPYCGQYCTRCQSHNPQLCQNCQYGYWNDNGYCRKCKTAYCQVCQPPDGSTCTQCLQGYTLDHQTGKCVSYYRSQAHASFNGELADGEEHRRLQSTHCGPYCVHCNNPPYCQNCQQGYWNDNGNCEPCHVAGCRVCQPPDGYTCTQCKRGYTLNNGRCVWH